MGPVITGALGRLGVALRASDDRSHMRDALATALGDVVDRDRGDPAPPEGR